MTSATVTCASRDGSASNSSSAGPGSPEGYPGDESSAGRQSECPWAVIVLADIGRGGSGRIMPGTHRVALYPAGLEGSDDEWRSGPGWHTQRRVRPDCGRQA